jgi:hypothetical protein
LGLTGRHLTRWGEVRYGFPISELQVTQQYISGQFSLLLEDLRPPAGEWRNAVHDLRRRMESSPLTALPRLAREALDLADMICWVALEQGDISGFRDYANAAVALGEFADNARLLPE